MDTPKAALQSLVQGDPKPFSALTSRADDATIFGTLGVYKRGSDQARQDTEFVASRLRGGTLSIEPLAMGLGGDLGYTVWLERGQVCLVGRDRAAPLMNFADQHR